MQQVSDKESEILVELGRAQLGVPGDYVEFGCYRGDSSLLLARLLREADGETPDRVLWIYDSFEGLPEKTAEDASVAGEGFRAGELRVSKREVMERFRRAGLRMPVIRKAFFEELDAERDLPAEISFAFLDGDLYGSIKTSLALVGPKMSERGVILVHDYNNPQLPGVARAVEEWLGRAGRGWKLSQRESLAVLRRG